MSKTYKNPNKDKRIKRKESSTHEDRRLSRRILDQIVDEDKFDEDLEDFSNNRMPFDKRPLRPRDVV